MTKQLLPVSGEPSGWQLLAETAADRLPGSEEQLLAQLMAAVQELNLQPPQLGRISNLFSRALSRGTHREEPARPSPIRARIWLLRSCTHDCGWGFFLVETTGERAGSTAPAETGRLVQLFLYQERNL
jgi:hypothetical protein